MPQNVRLALARVFYILSGDAAVSAFIPFHCHGHALSTCDAFIEGVTLDAIHSKEEMAEDCPELAQFISACEGTAFLPLVLNLICYLVSFVGEGHANDPPCDSADPIPGIYDPESRIEYYFTDHGCRVHEMPKYDMNTARHNADIYDDAPEHDVCSKRKAASATGEFNFTVFCFCPMHGKCLGFHSMPGAEGPF